MSDQTLLIVDDEPEIREMIRRHLEDYDFTILEADSGEEAWEIIQTKKIHIILLDIMMPGMSGIELLEKISPPTLVIMISAYSEKEHLREALKHNVFDFIEKPVEMDALCKRVENASSQIRLQHMVDTVVEHFVINQFKITKETINQMGEKEKSRVLSQAVALIKIKESKRQVA